MKARRLLDIKAVIGNPEGGPFPSWHVPGQCHAGTRMVPRHEPRPAEYWSLAPNGYWFAECAECCAKTRSVGVDCPDLAPLRVCSV